MPATYPDGTNLQTFLATTGLMSNPPTGNAAAILFSDAVYAATDEFEARTGAALKPAAATARTFAQPASRDGILVFSEPLAGSPTAFTRSGSALVLDTDYHLLQRRGGPGTVYWGARLAVPGWTPHSFAARVVLSLTGFWGWSSTAVNYDAWLAIVKKAAASVVQQLIVDDSRGLVEVHNLDVTLRWGEKRLAEERSAWEAEFEAAIRRYRWQVSI